MLKPPTFKQDNGGEKPPYYTEQGRNKNYLHVVFKLSKGLHNKTKIEVKQIISWKICFTILVFFHIFSNVWLITKYM